MKHSVNGNPSITLAANDYDELGRIEKTIQGDNANLDNNYRYNVRSWLETKRGYQFNTALEYGLTGNISSMEWEQNNKLREYVYNYDGLSRLLAANFTESTTDEKYSTNYKYDKHGNILSLRREGKADSCYATIDSLAIRSQGNQMVRVVDNGMSVSLPESNAFEQGSTKSTQYAYNKNGAMTMDLNKKITDISYNVLNLPSKLVIDSITHTYTYAADGRKLRVQQGEDKRDYAGSVIYEDSSLKRVLVDGGYAEKEGDNWIYHFYFNDHLGNNVVVADQDGNAIQNNSYYPFGLPMATASDSIQGLQLYKYNGKEFERKDGLKLYDYGARHYDAQVGRFTTVDPHAENYYGWSPYHYAANNPARITDPTGMDWYESASGNVIWRKSQDEEYVDDDGNIWKNIGTEYIFQKGDRAILFQQKENEDGELVLESTKLEIVDEAQVEYTAKIEAAESQLSTSASRRAARKWRQTHTFSDLLKFYATEVVGQYTDPVRVVGGLSAGIGGYSALSSYSRVRVTLGKNANQIHHTFRHIDKLGLSRTAVSKTVMSDLKFFGRGLNTGQMANRVITVNGQRIQYTVYKLPDGTLNVGRIHGI